MEFMVGDMNDFCVSRCVSLSDLIDGLIHFSQNFLGGSDNIRQSILKITVTYVTFYKIFLANKCSKFLYTFNKIALMLKTGVLYTGPHNKTLRHFIQSEGISTTFIQSINQSRQPTSEHLENAETTKKKGSR